MLTSQDLTKINKIVVTAIELRLGLFKEELLEQFYTKVEMDTKFSQVLTAVDSIAKSQLVFQQEMASMNYRLKNTEDWIDKAAPQIGINFGH